MKLSILFFTAVCFYFVSICDVDAQQRKKRQQVSREQQTNQERTATTTSKSVAPVTEECRKTIKRVQELLTELGYNPGPINGLMNTRTEAAILAAKDKHKLPATTEVNEALLLYLYTETRPIRKDKERGSSGMMGWTSRFTWNTYDGKKYQCSYEFFGGEGGIIFVGDIPSECYGPIRSMVENHLKSPVMPGDQLFTQVLLRDAGLTGCKQ
jgi:hypothetical protein